MEATNSIIVHNYRRAFASNSTITSFTAPVRRLTPPHRTNTNSCDYIRPTAEGGARGFSFMVSGTGADDSTIAVRVVAWKRAQVTASNADTRTASVYEYIPIILWAGTATLSTLTGIADGFGTSERFADTQSETTALPTAYDALTGLTATIHSPGSNASEATVFIEDASHVFDGFTFETDVGTATDANVHWAPLH